MVGGSENTTSPSAGADGLGCGHRQCPSATVTKRMLTGNQRSGGVCDPDIEESASSRSMIRRGFILCTATAAAALLAVYLLLVDAHPLTSHGSRVGIPSDVDRHRDRASAGAAPAGLGARDAAPTMLSRSGTPSRRLEAMADSLRGAARGSAGIESAWEAVAMAPAAAVEAEVGREQGGKLEEDVLVETLPWVISSEPRGLSDSGDVNRRRLEAEEAGDGKERESRQLAANLNVTQRKSFKKERGRVWINLKGHPRCYTQEGVHKCHANVYYFGVSKCGTTSLGHWMSKHPALKWITNIHYPGRVMGEAHIFDNSVKNYHHMLKLGRNGEWGVTTPEANTTDVVIDYTPHYSIMAEVPFRILERYGKHAFDGSVKFIVLLREPVARMISSWQYKFDVNSIDAKPGEKFVEGRPLAEAFNDGRMGMKKLFECRDRYPELKKKGIANILTLDLVRCNPHRYMEHNQYVAHVGKSMYALQLERWITLFGRENMKVIFLEEMAVDPIGTLEAVLEFIGVSMLDDRGENLSHEPGDRRVQGLPSREDWEREVAINHNQTGDRKKDLLQQQVTPELVQEMRHFFAPYNSELEELLGRPLPDNWSKSPPPA